MGTMYVLGIEVLFVDLFCFEYFLTVFSIIGPVTCGLIAFNVQPKKKKKSINLQ